MEKTEIPNEKIKIRNANKSQAENSEPICEDEDKNEENEVEAAEKVINAMLYYQKHALLKFKKATDSAKFEYRFDRSSLFIECFPDNHRLQCDSSPSKNWQIT